MKTKFNLSRVTGAGPSPAVLFIVLAFLTTILSSPAVAKSPSNGLKEGRFLDNWVEGLTYISQGAKTGVTDADGTFTYREGKTVQFRVGTIFIGEETMGAPILTPMDLVPDAVDPTHPVVANISRFLQTLDDNGNLEDGILITDEVRARANGEHLDFTLTGAAFENAAQAVLEGIYGENPPTLVSAQAAQAHLKESLLSIVETTRDDKGVWFISGEEYHYSIFEAMGYAVATDRLWQSETYRRTARGTLAEILGESQLETDIFVRTMGYSDQEMEEAFDNLDRATRTMVKSYVDGFNRRIEEVRADRDLLPFEFKAVGGMLGVDFVPEDWTVLDVVAWMTVFLRNFDPEAYDAMGQLDNAALYQQLAYTFPNDFQAMFEDLRWLNDPDALTYIPANRVPGKQKSQAVDRSVNVSSLPNLKKAAEKVEKIHKKYKKNLKEINAYVKMGSQAWAVAGSKTASGNPIIYSGPEMGFSVPAIAMEGSVQAGEYNVSGMALAGVPGIMVGRTPHHAWTTQVGHAHTVDFYLEPPSAVSLHRIERIKVAGQPDVYFPIYRTAHGPVINPIPYDPATYVPSPENPIISWKYSHWGYEIETLEAFFGFAQAGNMDEFGEAVEKLGAGLHLLYADRDGNIAYWMAGRDPVRPEGDYRFPQGFFPGVAPLEWDASNILPRSTDRNNSRGFYCGWNNKTNADYKSSPNNLEYQFGPFHRAQVIHDYISSRNDLTFEELRDLALDVSTTISIGFGENPWDFIAGDFSAAVLADPNAERLAALDLLEEWDGHYVSGGKFFWVWGLDRSDGWTLMDAWVREVLRMTFEDELGPETYAGQPATLLVNVLLHAFGGESSGVVNRYDWFQNLSNPDAPQNADAIIVAALDVALATLGDSPWGLGARGEIVFQHDLLGVLHTIPWSSRPTYAQCIEFESSGPVRIESHFPMGQSGTILLEWWGFLFDDNFFSMTPEFYTFTHRDFPLFE